MSNPSIEPRKGTKAGYHYYQEYRDCPRKFFLHGVLHLDTASTGPALITGAAFHDGKEKFYQTGDKKAAVELCTKEIQDRRGEFAYIEDYESGLARFPLMLDDWIEKKGFEDLDLYNVLSTEHLVEVPLPGTNHRITMRFDAVLQYKSSGNVVIMETKTTQSSATKQVKMVQLGDQATTYYWGFKKAYPDRSLMGILPDVTYWNKRSSDPAKIEHHRPATLVVRSKRQCQEFELYMTQLLSDISQRIAAWKAGTHPAIALFGRDRTRCFDYYRECQYLPICDGCNVEDPDFVSDGFIKSEGPIEGDDE